LRFIFFGIDRMGARLRVSAKRQVAKLTKIGIALSGEHDLERLLTMIVTEARRLLTCDAASLYTIEEDHLRFRVVQCGSMKIKERTAALQPMLFKIDTSRIATYVALTGRPLNIPNVYKIPPASEYGFRHDVDALTKYKTRSVLAVPIRDREQEILGVLQLINALDAKGRDVPENVVPFTQDCEHLALALASQAGVAMRNAQLLEDLRGLFQGIVRFSSAAIDARDPSAVGHSRRVSELVLRMAKAVSRSRRPPFARLSFSPRQLEALRYAGWLHDVGKIAISEDLLRKGHRLSPSQLEIVKGRFSLIRQGLISEALTEKVRLLRRRGQGAEKQIARVEQRLQARLDTLESHLSFIIASSGARPLGSEEKQRLVAIAAKRWRPTTGEVHPYLTREELEHLSIPKGTLTREELTEVRRHARETERFLLEIPFRGWLKDTPRVASLHHEMLDGSGYPYGLKGDQVPIEARMLAIADTFDAMTAADRPYRKALPLRRALKILREEAGRNRLDPDLVALFCRNALYYPLPLPRKGAPGREATGT
jgi:HD-GYP domain-containing protein (c-di-GMP phosphodiesterase class II)